MVIWTLIYYASPRVLQHVRIIVAYTWFVNVSIVILVPVDVWTAICLEGEAGPTGMASGLSAAVCGSKLSVQFMWSFSYWSAYFLTWMIIPMMQGYEDAGGLLVNSGYEDAGDFTAKERLRTSVRTNLMLIGIVGAVAVVGIIILLATKEMAWDNIVSLAIGASNAFALITGALLLGYGLVEIPRGLWSHADLAERHKWLSVRVARAAQKLDQAHQELSTAIVIAQATSLQMPRHDPLRPMMEIIDAMASEDAGFKPSGGQIGENDMDYDADAKSMAALRRRLRNAQDNYSRCKTEYCTVVWEALQLEETLHNCYQGTGRYTSYLRAPRKGFFAPLLDVVEWWWRCAIRSHVVRAFALLLGLISLAILFAEATLLSQKWVDLSLFSVLVRAAALHGEAVQLIVFVPLVYLCVCTYFSLFKLGMFSFYYLVPAHTDSVSLLINCSMVSRYAAPMCYNFLSLIHLRHYNYATGSVEPLITVFEKRMGVLPKSFDRVYPLCMVAWSLLIALNVHHRLFDSVTHLLSHCRGLYSRTWRRLRFDDDGEGEDVGVDGRRVVVKGHMILQRERATIERGLPVGESVVPLARHFSSKDLHASSSASSLLSGHYSTPTKVPHTDPSSSSSADPLLDSRLAAVRPAGGKPAADSTSTKDPESASLLRAADTSSGSVKYSGIAAGSSAGGSARKPQRPPPGGASGASSGAASPAAGVAARLGLEASIKSSSAGDLLPLGREKSRQASVPGSPLLLSRAASPLVASRLPPISTSAHSTPHHLSTAVAAAPAGSVTPTRPLSPPSLLSSALGLSSAAMVSTPQRYFWAGQGTTAVAAGAGEQQGGTQQGSSMSPTESPLISGQRGAAAGSVAPPQLFLPHPSCILFPSLPFHAHPSPLPHLPLPLPPRPSAFPSSPPLPPLPPSSQQRTSRAETRSHFSSVLSLLVVGRGVGVNTTAPSRSSPVAVQVAVVGGEGGSTPLGCGGKGEYRAGSSETSGPFPSASSDCIFFHPLASPPVTHNFYVGHCRWLWWEGRGAALHSAGIGRESIGLGCLMQALKQGQESEVHPLTHLLLSPFSLPSQQHPTWTTVESPPSVHPPLPSITPSPAA
ncbi:unnamed protein product [Closterium sp. NIES-65]|nr:unnamed protein product [Closterium sp. NIES-65]